MPSAVASASAGLVTFVLLAIQTHFADTPFNNYTLMADAWLHGHAYLSALPGPTIDAIPFHGRSVLVEAPWPGVLMLPLVLVWGVHANQVFLSIVLGSIALGATWLLCLRLDTTFGQRLAVAAFFLFGTSLYWCSAQGGVWYLAHVSVAAFTMLAFAELAGPRRGWLVAVYACAAGLSRFPLFVALPFYAALIPPNSGKFWNRRLAFFVVAAIGIACWVWDNYARYGTWNDIGLTVLYHQSIEQFDHYGAPFTLRNLPKQLTAYLFAEPSVNESWPYLHLSRFGFSILWQSPALAVAFLARAPKRTVFGLWLLTILVSVPQLLYFSTGDVQLGMRHALDFEPFTIALVILALRDRRDLPFSPLFGLSIAIGIYGVWYWHAMHW